MHTKYTVALARIIKEFSLEILSLEGSADEIMISTAEINRPGLQMAGYFEFFDSERIQLIGKSEISFLKHPRMRRCCRFMMRSWSHTERQYTPSAPKLSSDCNPS